MESVGQLETNETDNSDGRTPRPLRGVGGVRPSEAFFYGFIFVRSVSEQYPEKKGLARCLS